MMRLMAEPLVAGRVDTGLLRDFGTWMTSEQRRVNALCRHMLQDPDEADSATQDVFLKAYQALLREEERGAIAPDDLPAVAPSYEQALFADLDTALERLPHERIAVQWDVAVEFGALEGAMGTAMSMDQIAPGLVRCIERVPATVPVGMHLCYGDYGHQHFKQPESLQMQADVVNAVTSAARRPVNFVSFTVPQGRNDRAYFEPLGGLRTGSDTELYFALVPYHPDQQAPGTTAEQIEHIDAALLTSPGGARHWGICTECGMGRVDAGDVPGLLDLHTQILDS